MSIWLIGALMVGGVAAILGVARARARRGLDPAQDPQNLYPLW